ncbi:MAG: nicotinamide mononucleotide transporter [Phycisphaerae bacterium]|nr:nicotinamide mononucleotide transporter [Phycisphaerae bacterium]
MNWFIAAIALMGVYLNTRCKWQGFLLWLISNAWWCCHNVSIGEYAQAMLFGAYWFLSLYGIFNWKRKGANHGR